MTKEKVTELINRWIAKGEITTRSSKVVDLVVYIKPKKMVYFIEELQSIIKTENFSFFDGIILIYLEGGMKITVIPQ